MLDYHVHSNISADSEEEMEDICEYAVKSALTEICFTEHLDIDYPYENAVFLPNLDLYDEKINAARQKNPSLIIKKGLEVGLQPEAINKTNLYLAGREYDFIIASQHVISGQDPYYGTIFEGRTKKQVFALYLTELLTCLKLYDRYNVVGHIGYPGKFCPLKDKVLHYSDHSELLDEILKTIIQAGKGLEVNSSSFLITGEDMPQRSILKRYRELRGELITIGSDAHLKERLGFGYARVTDYLKDLGFKTICTFENMKPYFIKI